MIAKGSIEMALARHPPHITPMRAEILRDGTRCLMRSEDFEHAKLAGVHATECEAVAAF